MFAALTLFCQDGVVEYLYIFRIVKIINVMVLQWLISPTSIIVYAFVDLRIETVFVTPYALLVVPQPVTRLVLTCRKEYDYPDIKRKIIVLQFNGFYVIVVLKILINIYFTVFMYILISGKLRCKVCYTNIIYLTIYTMYVKY